MYVLLTGASGFVGSAVLSAATQRGIKIRPVFRSIVSTKKYSGAVFVPILDADADWGHALHGVEVVIHAAAQTNVVHGEGIDVLSDYWRVNVLGTLNLARQSAAAGVKRFVFISSIKVNGEVTLPDSPFTAEDPPKPEDAYATSKAEAEKELRHIAQFSGMDVTVIRPPLIYGPGVRGNFLSLLNWVRRGVPLPLGGVTDNRRSLVGLENLVDLIFVCVDHPKAGNQTFLISDGEDLSTTELLRRIGKALNFPVRLISVPASLIDLIAKLLGKKALSQRLLDSLQVDISKTCELLDWRPSVSVDEGLRMTVK